MQESLLTFPCAFPIKIIGKADETFEGIVIEIINQHVPDLGEGAIVTKLSNGDKYLSMTVTIQAKSQEQLDSIYTALSFHPAILVAL